MSGIVDAAIILIAFLLFVLVFVASTTHPPVGKPALVYSGVALVGPYSCFTRCSSLPGPDGTPGMRYAQNRSLHL